MQYLPISSKKIAHIFVFSCILFLFFSFLPVKTFADTAACKTNITCTKNEDCGPRPQCNEYTCTKPLGSNSGTCRINGDGASGTRTEAFKATKRLTPVQLFDTAGNPKDMISSDKDKDVTIVIPIPPADLGKSAAWGVRVRCGDLEERFPVYTTKDNPNSLKEVANGLELKLHNDALVFSMDCEFQPAGVKLTQPIELEIVKDNALYGRSFYTVDAPIGKALDNAITDPNPLTEKATSATITVKIPPADILGTTESDWKLQPRCGVGGYIPLFGNWSQMPGQIPAKTIGTDNVSFTITNDPVPLGSNCQFTQGDPIDIEIYRTGTLYGRSLYSVKPANAASFLPPPCTKWIIGDPNNPAAQDVTQEVKRRIQDNTLDDWWKRQTDPIKCAAVKTAIGDINTGSTSFIQWIYGLLLSLAGGIALVLIMFAGYQIMTSQGNPEKIQAARETITSAIIGLLFIIFSLVLLQIIGVNIVHIPGLGK